MNANHARQRHAQLADKIKNVITDVVVEFDNDGICLPESLVISKDEALSTIEVIYLDRAVLIQDPHRKTFVWVELNADWDDDVVKIVAEWLRVSKEEMGANAEVVLVPTVTAEFIAAADIEAVTPITVNTGMLGVLDEVKELTKDMEPHVDDSWPKSL